MKKFNIKIFLVLFVICIQLSVINSQNLVPNPSFEEYTICPNGYYMLPNDWYTCSADPDYFNACDTIYPEGAGVPHNGFGYQYASDGNGYCGFYALGTYSTWWSYKEYLGCSLINPLIIGQEYYISFKINLADHIAIDMCINNIGCLLSTKSYQDYQPYDSIWSIPTINFAHIKTNYIISDTVNWTTIKGSIIADSAYQYILIGNFFNVSQTDTVLLNNLYVQHKAYYFVDEVCISQDSLICFNSSSAQNIENQFNDIILYPNPADEYINFRFNFSQRNFIYCNIYNSLGKKIKTLINPKTFPCNELQNGIYLFQIIIENEIITQKIIINH